MTNILLFIIALGIWALYWRSVDIFELLDQHEKPWLHEADDNTWLAEPKKRAKK